MRRRTGAWLSFLLFWALLAGAQTPDATGAENNTTQNTQEDKPSTAPKRLLGIVPQYNVSTLKTAKPLSPREKWHLFVQETFDPFQFVAVGFEAGISQATNGYASYGQGAEGYGKRYGAGFADQVSGGFFGGYLFPVLFKEDPRYLRMGEGKFKQRLLYSVETTVITRTDAGTRRFNFSNVFGNLAAGALANVYYPREDRGIGLTFTRAAVVTGMGSLGALGEEFWPDVWNKVFRRKHSKAQSGN